ncbi:MAG TPA: META domain-containing protein [Allosphingosinicella sp.]|jgi:heat shock protein HslJ
MFLVRLALIAQAACLAASCGAAPPTKAAATKAEPSLYGRWRIVEVNGAAPLSFGTPDSNPPHLIFTPATFGGSSGCNSFGGTGLLVGDRWFGEPPTGTQQGCGTMTAQEEAIFAIAWRGPKVVLTGEEATLTGAAGSLRLRRDAVQPDSAVQPRPMLLAGTAWEIGNIDGRPVGERSGHIRARLRFDADRWSLDAGCGALGGAWRQEGRAVTMSVATKQPARCSPTLKAEDDAVRAMAAAGPHYVVGHNRELVMGGATHWLTGRFDNAAMRLSADLLLGEWRVASVDGVAPKPTPRPPSVAFGKAGYAVWDGCNHTEGVALVVSGQLFTRGSGMSTLANCAPDPLRQRVPHIVGSNPRVAKTADGLALVSTNGTLSLTRLSQRPFGTGEQLGLRGPRSILLLGPDGRLTLKPGGKFAIDLACGRIEGDWRGGQPARFSPDPLERTAPRCDQSPGSDAFRLSQFFTGNVLAVTGPNRDIVLLVNEDRSLPGRVAE